MDYWRETPQSLRVVSEARRAMRLHEYGVFARFRYNDLKEAAWPKKSCKTYFTTDNGQTFKRVVILPSSRLPHSVDMTTGDSESDPDIVAVLKNAFARWQNDVLGE